MMIDKPIDVTPDALRHEAKMLRYTGRGHAATIMEWTADRIAVLEDTLKEIAGSSSLRANSGFGWIAEMADQALGGDDVD